jgi:uncharacterized protein
LQRNLVALGCGLLFAAGLGIAGMTDPRRVVAFLDVTGAWDPSLALVMVGAIAVNAAAFRWVLRAPAPLLATRFRITHKRRVDAQLVGGAALFGVGWGLSGYCPGPALVAMASLNVDTLLFGSAMLAGMAVHAAGSGALFAAPSADGDASISSRT